VSGTLNLVPRPTAGGAMAITVFPYKYVANKHGNKECYKHISTNLQKRRPKTIPWRLSSGRGKGKCKTNVDFMQRLYRDSLQRRSGTDHTVLPANTMPASTS